MTIKEWKERIKSGRLFCDEAVAKAILKDWEDNQNFLQKIIDDNQDAAVLEFQRENESKGDIVGIARFRHGDKGYGQHHE